MNTAIDMLRQFFAAINRNDMDAMADHFAEEIIRTEPEGWPTAGAYKGIDQVRSNIRKGRETWAEGSCDPEKHLISGDKVVVYLHARVRLASSNEWVGGRFADGFVVNGDKILEDRTFWERKDALAWAHISDEEPG